MILGFNYCLMLFLMIYCILHYHQAIEFLEKNIIINF